MNTNCRPRSAEWRRGESLNSHSIVTGGRSACVTSEYEYAGFLVASVCQSFPINLRGRLDAGLDNQRILPHICMMYVPSMGFDLLRRSYSHFCVDRESSHFSNQGSLNPRIRLPLKRLATGSILRWGASSRQSSLKRYLLAPWSPPRPCLSSSL